MHLHRPFLKLATVLVTSVLIWASVAPAYAQNGSIKDKTITLGYVNWTEAIAVTHLMQAVLEKNFNVNVKLKLVTPQQAFQGVAAGKLDAFLDVWLPDTHAKYWQEYQDQVDDLGVWYQGVATLGIGVPNYVDAETIGDLAKHADAYGHKIIGIQPGAGVMQITKGNVMPAYGLEDFTLVSGTTAAMVEAIDKAIRNREPIAFTAWKPHWLFAAYPLRYLEDPKNTMAQADHLHAIARKGLKDDAPRVYKVLNSFRLNPDQLGSLELAVADARSAWGGVRRWLAKNKEVVAPWVIAGSPERRDYLY